MALINCRNCGKQVSDRAEKCVHCGASIRSGEETRNLELVPSSQTDVQPTLNQQEPASRKGGSNLPIISMLIAFVLAFLAFGGWLYHSHVREQKALDAAREAQIQEEMRQQALAEAEEQARRDSIAAEKARQDSIEQVHSTIITGYLDKVHAEKGRSEKYGGGYYLYDMNQDGVPELLVYTGGEYFGDYSLKIYSFLSGAVKKVYDDSYFNCVLSQGRNYLLEVAVAQGTVGIEATKLTYSNGHVTRKTILSHEHFDDMESDGSLCGECEKYMTLPGVKWKLMSDEGPIRALFS